MMRKNYVKKFVILIICLSVGVLLYPSYLSLTRVTRFELLNNGHKQAVFDVIYNRVIDDDAYQYYLDEFNFYSYGPSGFIMADLTDGSLWVMFDEESDPGRIDYLRTVHLWQWRTKEGKNERYMREKVKEELTEKELQVYLDFQERKFEKMKFPNRKKIGYWQRGFGVIDYMKD